MKTTGIVTTHKHEVAMKYGQPIKLILFGDVHRDSPAHAETHWKQFLDYAKSQRDAVFLGMGDYLDGVSTSERGILMRSGLHESTLRNMENEANGRVAQLAKELSFMRGKLIGLIGGNHFWPFPDGTDSDMRLANKLSCRYLGVCSFIRLSMANCGRTHCVDIYAHHGLGGARLPGGSINRVQQAAEWADADILAMGHDHKRGVFPANPTLRLEPCNKNGLRLRHRERWLARTGSFLAAYEPGQANYNVDAGRGPCSLGWVEFEITVNRKRKHAYDSGETSVSIRGIA